MHCDPADTDKIIDGSGRIRTAADTLAWLLPRAKTFGITRLADVTGLDRIGIPVALAIRPDARSVTVSQGKGADITSAKVSALMEAVEVWHAENIDLPLFLESMQDVGNAGRSIDVARLPYVAGQERHGAWRVLWVEGSDLVSGRTLLIPFEMVHADYADPIKPGYGLFPASTNGLASGNNRLEAICSGICEVIERDAVAVWSARPAEKRAATRLDLATIDDSLAGETCRKIADAGLEIAVWDLACDLAVPSFLCLIREAPPARGHIGLGSGSHPRSATALMRALTEAAQTRLTYVTGSRDDLDPEEFTPAGLTRKWRWSEKLLRGSAPARDFAAIASHHGASLREQLEFLLQRLAACGIDEVAAIDLTKREIGIPVVRVVIPGLEAPHDDPGYQPGPRALAAAAQP
jgi:ribosomal protein S12 methylthiotransferase accessory factor